MQFQPFTHTFTRWWQTVPSKVPPTPRGRLLFLHKFTHRGSVVWGQLRAQHLAQGHFNTLTAEIGHRTTVSPITKEPFYLLCSDLMRAGGLDMHFGGEVFLIS